MDERQALAQALEQGALPVDHAANKTHVAKLLAALLSPKEMAAADREGQLQDYREKPFLGRLFHERFGWPPAQRFMSAVTLPGDVYAGQVDLGSEEGMDRIGHMAGLVTTSGIGAAAGRSGSTLGMAGGRLGKAADDLPMDEASVAARAREMGYSPDPFYRGHRTGVVPDEYPGGAYFSRDPGYSAGFARRGGQDAPREVRLNLQKAFDINAPVSAEHYVRLVKAAQQTDPKLAEDLVKQIPLPEGKGADWLFRFAEKHPDQPLTDSGGFVLQSIEQGSHAPANLLKKAGFDTILSGRDARKLTGHGIRDKEAVFDPSAADSTNVYRGIAAGGLGLGLAAQGFEDDR